MLTFIGISLFAAGVTATNPPDIAGQWSGEDWGQVVLTQTAPGHYTGTYTDTLVKEECPGKIDLKWSRIERRFNGTWREGDDDRFGTLSIRLVGSEIRGGLTTDDRSKVNPGTPQLGDLVWTRAEWHQIGPTSRAAVRPPNEAVIAPHLHALHFDGASAYVDLGHTLDFSKDSAFSVSFWMNSTGVDRQMWDRIHSPEWQGRMNDNADQQIVGKSPVFFGDKEPGWSIFTNKAGFLYLQLNGSSEPSTNILQAYELRTRLNDAKWHHVVVSYNGNQDVSGVRFYIDGTSQPLGIDENSLRSGDICNDIHASIGATVTGKGFYRGALSEMRIFDRALAAADAAKLYSAETSNRGSVEISGLIAGYHLDEGEGTTVHDFSGHGKDGTLHGNVTWGSGPGMAAGQHAHAMHFNQRHYALVPPSTKFTSGDFTMSLWLKPSSSGWRGPTQSQIIVARNFGYRDQRGDIVLQLNRTSHQLDFTARGEVRISPDDREDEGYRTSRSDWIFGWDQSSYLTCPINYDRWNFVAITRRGDRYSIWMNGERVRTERSSGDISDADNTNSFKLGTGNGAPPNDLDQMYKGDIDDFRIFRRCLSDEELAELYKSGGDETCLQGEGRVKVGPVRADYGQSEPPEAEPTRRSVDVQTPYPSPAANAPHPNALHFDQLHYAMPAQPPKFTSGDFTMSLWLKPASSGRRGSTVSQYIINRNFYGHNQPGDFVFRINRLSGDFDFCMWGDDRTRYDTRGNGDGPPIDEDKHSFGPAGANREWLLQASAGKPVGAARSSRSYRGNRADWIFGWDVPETRMHGPLRFDQWNHVVVARSGDAYTLWMNGIRVVTDRSAANVSDADNVNPFTLGGATSEPGVHELYKGDFDDFRVFRRCLSDREIGTLYDCNGDETALQGEGRVQVSPLVAAHWNAEPLEGEKQSQTVPPLSDQGKALHPGAVQFDGGHFAMPPKPPKFTSGDFSISLWFNPLRTGNWQYLFMRGFGYRDMQGDIGLKLHRDSGNLDFQARTADSQWLFGWDIPESRLHSAVRYCQWNHVVVTRRGETYTMWMNGTRVGSQESSADISDAENSHPFIVGAFMGEGLWGDFYRGALDDFRVFCRCVSDKEIGTLYDCSGDETALRGEGRVALGPLIAGRGATAASVPPVASPGTVLLPSGNVVTDARGPATIAPTAVAKEQLAIIRATEEQRAKQREAEMEQMYYRDLLGKLKAQIMDAQRSGKPEMFVTFTNNLNNSVNGRLLYLRVLRIDQYASKDGVDVPAATTALIDKPLNSWKVPVPAVRNLMGEGPHISRHSQDFRDWSLLESGRLENGRYADDIVIQAAVSAKRPEEWPTGSPEVKAAIALLEQPWQTNVTDQEFEAAAAKLKPAADAAVDEIMRTFNRSGQLYAYRHRAVQLLARMGTPKARATLLDIALGHYTEDLANVKPWASTHYLRITSDPAEIRKLLASNDAEVLGNALRALKGKEVDEELFKRLAELTAYKTKEPHSQRFTRVLAADVMAADPSGRYAAQKVEAILAAAEDVSDMPDADKVQKLHPGTNAETFDWRYLRALVEMRGADEALRRAAARAVPPASELLAIARAQRGDATARKELYPILNDPRANLRRAWAADGLAVVGTKDDVPLLKKLADSDPLERGVATDVGPPDKRPTYFPVRDAARRAIEQIESR